MMPPSTPQAPPPSPLTTQDWQHYFGAGKRRVDLLYTALTMALFASAAARYDDAAWLRTQWAVCNLVGLSVPALALAAPQRYTTLRTPLLLAIRTVRWTVGYAPIAHSRRAMMLALGDQPGSRGHISSLLSAPILMALSSLGFALPLKAHVPAQLVALASMAAISPQSCKAMCQHPGMRRWYQRVANLRKVLSNLAMVRCIAV